MGSLRTTSNCRALAAFNFGIGSFKPSRLKSCHLQSTNCKTSVNCRHSALCAWTNAGVRNKSRLVLIAGLYATVIPWAPFVSTNSLLPSTPPTKPAKRRTGGVTSVGSLQAKILPACDVPRQLQAASAQRGHHGHRPASCPPKQPGQTG